MSVRDRVRVAAVDAYGEILNEYPGHHHVVGDEPDRPWAVYLADSNQSFRLLCFDLDAKTPSAAAGAERDAAVLTDLLADAGLTSVVCVSGPTGGRHVWTGLADAVDADTVASLARLAKHLCPTLDLSPLTNAVTGCVRPPGAPHRSGGRSYVLSGDIATLTAPTGTAAQVSTVVERLAHVVEQAEPVRVLRPSGPLPVDDDGHVHIDGPKRHVLPAFGRAALQESPGVRDGSSILWSVLIAAAAAGWHHSDVAALVDTAPGLEHVRTYQSGVGRRPRPLRGDKTTQSILRRQWDKAVRYVAANARTVGSDPTFDARAGAIATHVRVLQARADASVGRWSHGGGPADRRVLDALSVFALQAVTPIVEADIRRLALMAGIGRETARTALLRLANDGWIVRSQASQGASGARWLIDPQAVFHRETDPDRSQAVPPRLSVGAAERTALLRSLTARVDDAAHDLFTYGAGLGLLAGLLYARLDSEPQGAHQIASTLGLDPEHVQGLLECLTTAGILMASKLGWSRLPESRLDVVAAQRGVGGRCEARARRYRIERELWAWWQAEKAWLNAPRRVGAKRRPSVNQIALVVDGLSPIYAAYPRRVDGRLDWRKARLIIESSDQQQEPPLPHDPMLLVGSGRSDGTRIESRVA